MMGAIYNFDFPTFDPTKDESLLCSLIVRTNELQKLLNDVTVQSYRTALRDSVVCDITLKAIKERQDAKSFAFSHLSSPWESHS